MGFLMGLSKANHIMAPGIEMKVENRGQYEEYLKELEPIREELGISLKETMYPEGTASGRDYDFGAYQSH